ncbi:putative S-layer protein [Synechococcus sp. PCC 7502]|uniref:iron uptake porin n=1 Tax=Synechococcus sp. PCC 7502 TaxID=1173263 RepID=UPI00029F945F|nr:iron uptake porin [Synechococcus sp. PCC 7502]AFY74206.1 putative S-layer protein [Synechococcus sp. PCC 7502]
MKKFTIATLGVIAALGGLAPTAFADTQSVEPSASTLQKLSKETGGTLSQVTSVSQLSDVQPTDWAFTALQSLVERYGCIAGYPNGTYRGSRALSRYEFAAGLNACLDKINELISTGLADKVGKADLATLQKLQTEFAAELTALKGRVDALESKVETLEAQQFSTVTKLNAEVITFLTAANNANGFSNNVTLSTRVRLNFDTSFTGKDNLNVRLAAQNVALNSAPSPDEIRLLPSSSTGNTFILDNLIYNFPLTDKLTVYVGTSITDVTYIGVDSVTPLGSYATGAISNFANSNPSLYPFTTGSGAAGGSLSYKFSDNFVGTAGYIAEAGASASPSVGVTGGGRMIFANLNAYFGKLNLGLFYANTFSPAFGVDTLAGSLKSKVPSPNVTGNTGAIQARYDFSDKFQLAGWFGYTNASSSAFTGNAQIINYAVQFVFPDLFKEGNLAAITFGQQPTVVSSGAGVSADGATGFHIEGSYRFQLGKNISITPGIIYLTRPNQDPANSGVVVGVLRTSFVF